MLLELAAPRLDRGWRHVHLVRCFNFPDTIGAAMRAPGITTATTTTNIHCSYYDYDCYDDSDFHTVSIKWAQK